MYGDLAQGVNDDQLGGIIVWYATVINGAADMYDPTWDVSHRADSKVGMNQALKAMIEGEA